jgi:hypothetical protein
MPPGTDIMDNRTEVWLPLGFHREIGRNRSLHFLHTVGRLKDGVTLQAAQTELNGRNRILASGLAGVTIGSNGPVEARVTSGRFHSKNMSVPRRQHRR